MPKLGKKKKKDTRGMRLPNGFGSVTKLSGNRRRPYVAKITTGYEFNPETLKTKQVQKVVGWFETREDAISALAAYRATPYDIDKHNVTLEYVYEKWSSEYFQRINPSSVRTITAAYRYCEPLYKQSFNRILPGHMKECILNADVGPTTKSRMKSLFNLLFDYAVEHGYATINHARNFKMTMLEEEKKKSKKERIPFSSEEIQRLWDNVDYGFTKMILIALYTGWRPQEEAILKLSDIDLENHTMIGGLKTDAGKNRIVPIHPDILPLIQYYYNEAISLHSEYLFNDITSQTGKQMTYDKYRQRFIKVINALELNPLHRPHDTRHTFISRWKAQDLQLNEHILNLIVGHEENDVSEKVYTHRSTQELYDEMLNFYYKKVQLPR